MIALRSWWRYLNKPDEGATMVEYALMVALIALVAFIAVQVLGGETSSAYQSLADTWPSN